MKLILKILTGIIVLVVVLAVGGVLAIKGLAPSAIANYVKEKTGSTMTWTRFDLQPLGGNLFVNGLEITNPPGFQTELMIRIPELRLDTDLGSFSHPPYRINDLTLHIETLNIVYDANGRLNFEQIQKAFAPAEQPQQPSQEPAVVDTPEEAAQQAPDVFFGQIKLQVDTVRLVNYSTSPTRTTTVPVNLVIEQKDISLADLQKVIRSRVLPIVVRQLGPIIGKEALGTALGLSNKAADAATETLQKGTKAASSTIDAASEAGKEATKGLKNAAKSIKNLFGN